MAIATLVSYKKDELEETVLTPTTQQDQINSDSNGQESKNGAGGTVGVLGKNGEDGVDGAQGETGTDGKDGTDGQDGAQGEHLNPDRSEKMARQNLKVTKVIPDLLDLRAISGQQVLTEGIALMASMEKTAMQMLLPPIGSISTNKLL